MERRERADGTREANDSLEAAQAEAASEVTVTHAKDALAEAFQYAIEELDGLIQRRFASQRVITIEQSAGGWYSATINGQLRFPPCPNLDTVIRFVRAFAEKEGVWVDEDAVALYLADRDEHSLRVPDNVVPIRERAEA